MRSGLVESGTRQADRLIAGLTDMAEKAQQLVREAGAHVDDTVDHTRSKLVNAGTAVSESAQYAARATDAYVRDNPWKVLGFAAAVGAIVAILLTRR